MINALTLEMEDNVTFKFQVEDWNDQIPLETYWQDIITWYIATTIRFYKYTHHDNSVWILDRERIKYVYALLENENE